MHPSSAPESSTRRDAPVDEPQAGNGHTIADALPVPQTANLPPLVFVVDSLDDQMVIEEGDGVVYVQELGHVQGPPPPAAPLEEVTFADTESDDTSSESFELVPISARAQRRRDGYPRVQFLTGLQDFPDSETTFNSSYSSTDFTGSYRTEDHSLYSDPSDSESLSVSSNSDCIYMGVVQPPQPYPQALAEPPSPVSADTVRPDLPSPFVNEWVGLWDITPRHGLVRELFGSSTSDDEEPSRRRQRRAYALAPEERVVRRRLERAVPPAEPEVPPPADPEVEPPTEPGVEPLRAPVLVHGVKSTDLTRHRRRRAGVKPARSWPPSHHETDEDGDAEMSD